MSENPLQIEASTQVREASQSGLDSRVVPMRLYVPEDLSIQYADNFNLFFSDYDITLSFFQTQSPIITTDTDWEKVEAIKAKCVARVVIPPHLMPRVINILSENWQRFLEARQAQLKERENVSKSTEAGAGDAPSEGSV